MLITCWGRSANRAKSSGAKCSELEEGHPLLMDGVRKGIRAGATFSCALWRREGWGSVETLAAEARM